MNTALFLRLVVATAASFCSFALLAADSPRERLAFNTDWKFARYGLQADGSRLPEPGAASAKFSLTASSEESGNSAEFAMDGDEVTRWCASGASTNQWLEMDLSDEQNVSRAVVWWEFPDLTYGFVIERSTDGYKWTPLPGAARFVRVRTTSLPAGKWASIREVKLFDADDKEILNTQPHPAPGTSPSAAFFDDSRWRTLDVPHDWAIEGPFRYDLPGNTGKLPWRGVGWYRKHFTIPAADTGRRISVEFDGAMANAEVWLNGEYVGTWPFPYNGFRFDLTDKIKFGGDNVLAVRLDTEKWNSRWYPGAGIYRSVWLEKTQPVHIAQWGVCVTTPNVAAASAEAHIAVTVDNQQLPAATDAKVHVEIFELVTNGKIGKKVATSVENEVRINKNASAKTEFTVNIEKPKLWDIASPNRYLARAIVRWGAMDDVYDQSFGIRTIEFKHDDGFHLNGKRLQLYGVCNHHDLGALGAAFNLRAATRQLEILKEMGCNALRTSHNPPAPELLDLCDKMGLVVICEAFDCWKAGKNSGDYSRLFAEWHVRDLQAMVRHFRNHPSIIMWSSGNEVNEQTTLNPAKELRDIIRAEDSTRPVTAGVWDAAARTDFRQGVDVQGLNYGIKEYTKVFNFPGNENRPFYSSESSSCISSRGEYFFPVKRGNPSRVNFQISSYDVDAPGWACPPDEEFAALDRNPGFAGEFVWTGFDYLGEPTPYNNDMSNLLNIHDKDPAKMAAMKKELEELGKIRVPSRSSYFGIVDLAGFPKDRYYIYQARWRPELPMAHILPHWNWPDRIGQVTPVHVYTSGDSAELFLNGKSLGKKTKGQFEYRLRWDDVVYQPGELKVVAYKNGKKWATDVMKTTGEPAKLALAADRSKITDDRKDLSYITVRVQDQNGQTVPTANNQLKFTIEGAGEIVATDNGDATSFVPFQSHERPAYNGLALVIVKSKKPGSIKLTASAEGLKPATVSLRSVAP